MFSFVIASNLMMLVGFEIVRLIGGTASVVISGSLGMIVSVIISVFVYKEHASRQAVISAILSVMAVVLSIF